MECKMSISTLVCLISLGLTACNQAATTSTRSPTQSEVPQATSTDVATSTSTVSVLSSPTTFPTPDFVTSSIAGKYLLEPGTDPVCQLPCWQGLRIGVSSREEIVSTFQQVFDFPKTLSASDLLLDQDSSEGIVRGLSVPGTEALGYYWDTPEDGYFDIYTLVDLQSGTLQGIQFHLYSVGSYDIHTMKDTIEVLGIPSELYGLYPGTLDFMMIYSARGIVSYISFARDQLDIRENEAGPYTTLCLDTVPSVTVDYIQGVNLFIRETQLK